jgi:hypothetical protein
MQQTFDKFIVLWPSKVLKLVSKRSNQARLMAESDLHYYSLTNNSYLQTKRPIFPDSGLDFCSFEHYIPR